jgi:hypothetical protein
MGDLRDLYSLDNVKRAWRWVLSNPDRSYKNHFRDAYAAYSTAELPLLSDLSNRIRRGIFHPESACKIYLPKKSGVLRPYSLLCVDDQIAYQAAVNVCADALYPKARQRYLVQVFGHLYAGRTSNWFYRKWSSGYAAFNLAATSAFNSGYRYTASFDLTACYDSIDHKVLCHFLRELRLSKEFCDRLTQWLSVWTATERNIFHGHGIPQGPLGSGMLSEVVLQHFDEYQWSPQTLKYLRYVDDIRLFAKDEKTLRKALFRLDRLSKDVGLFPQSNKINIHEVSDIRNELKTVSQPIESAVKAKIVDQGRIRARLNALSPRCRVDDSTRFKYVLAHAQPVAALTARLWKIYEHQPEFYEPIARYLARYKRMPKRAANALIQAILAQDLYQTIAATFIEVSRERLRGRSFDVARRRFKSLWKPKTNQADLTAALGRWLLSADHLTSAQIDYALRPQAKGWVKSQLLLELRHSKVDPVRLTEILDRTVRDPGFDAALCAAYVAALRGIRPNTPVAQMTPCAKTVLREFGIIRRRRGSVCGIADSLSSLIGWKPKVRWKPLFGASYGRAERQIVACRGYASTSATEWVNALDVFNDLLFHAVFTKDGGLGNWPAGNIGAALNSPASRFAKRYPRCYAYACETHDKRLESWLSHPTVRKTGRKTGPLRFTYIRRSLGLLKAAIVELEAAALV